MASDLPGPSGPDCTYDMPVHRVEAKFNFPPAVVEATLRELGDGHDDIWINTETLTAVATPSPEENEEVDDEVLFVNGDREGRIRRVWWPFWRIGSYKLDIKITDRDDYTHVTQTTYATQSWRLLLAITYLLVALLGVISYANTTLSVQVAGGMIIGFHIIMSNYFLFVQIGKANTYLEPEFIRDKPHETYVLYMPSLIQLVLIVGVAVGFLFRLASIATLLIAIFAAYVAYYRFEFFGRYLVKESTLEKMLPHLSLIYAITVLALCLPAFMVQFFSIQNLSEIFIDYLAALFGFVFAVFLIDMGVSEMSTYEFYEKDINTVASPIAQGVAVGISILIPFIGLYFVALTWEHYIPIIQSILFKTTPPGVPETRSWLIRGILLLLTSIPIVYLLIGFSYQVTSRLLEFNSLWYYSKDVELKTFPASDLVADRRITVKYIDQEDDQEDAYAASLSTGFQGYIFLSYTLIEELSPNELRAIVAHERAHIENRDAVLAFLCPFIATSLLLGQNVLYEALDFRSREFRADAEAATVVGSDVVQSSLDSYSKIGATGRGVPFFQTHPQLTPYMNIGFDTNSIAVSGVFQFFSSFAMSKAHPSPKERKRALELEH